MRPDRRRADPRWDVSTKAEIYALLRELATKGLAVLAISRDPPEIPTISDRILVMRGERLAGEIGFAEAAEEHVTALAALERPSGPGHDGGPPSG